MTAANWTTPHHSTFILLGIPGLEEDHVWISIPFCAVYFLSVMGNGLLLALIKSERSLHEPRYLFLAMLAFANLVISTTVVPKTLCIFWFRHQTIHIDACLAQMFLIHAISTMESGFMVAMAFDLYIAVCNPLRHSAILTHQAIAKMWLGIVLRGMMVLTPYPFLMKQLSYCTNFISHTYCEFLALVKLACEDPTGLRAYSLLTVFLTGGLDFTLIALSYTLILQAIFRLPSKEAQRKSLSTCSSHVFVITAFYTPALFSFFSQHFGHVAPYVHVLITNFCLLFPPMMDSLIYGVRTPVLRRRLLHILGLKLAKSAT